MKIAIIVCAFPPYKGGMGNAAFEQTKQLVKLGNKVTVFTPKYNHEQKRYEEILGIKVSRLTPVFKYGNGAFLPQLFWKLKDYDAVFLHYPFFGGAEVVWLRRILHIGSTAPVAAGDYGASNGLIHKFSTNIVRMFFRTPKQKRKQLLVIQYHMDVVGRGLFGLFFKVYAKVLMPLIIKSADKVIVSSFDYAENSDARKLVDNKWVEIPFGVDVKEIRNKEKRNKGTTTDEEIRDDEKMVLFVGALDRAHYFKGVDVLIEALSSIKHQASSIIVGDGDMRDHYENLVKKKGLNDKIKFAGKVSDEELIDYYRKATVLVLPSTDKSEAFGIVLIEAMACGIPVIASDLAGVRSVVDDGKTGFLVKPGDAEDLAQKIDEVLKLGDDVIEKMGEAGRRKVKEKYDWEKIGQELSRILHE